MKRTSAITSGDGTEIDLNDLSEKYEDDEDDEDRFKHLNM